MKKTLVFMSAAFLGVLCASSAFALPRCSKSETDTSFLGSWRKKGGVWEMTFACSKGERAKVGVETADNIENDEGVFFIMRADGSRDGEDYYNDACEAVADFCATSEEVEPDVEREPAGRRDENGSENLPEPAEPDDEDF